MSKYIESASERYFDPIFEELTEFVEELDLKSFDNATKITRKQAEELDFAIKVIAKLTREFWEHTVDKTPDLFPPIESYYWASKTSSYYANLRIFFRFCGIANSSVFAGLVSYYQMGYDHDIIKHTWKIKDDTNLNESHDKNLLEQQYNDLVDELVTYISYSSLAEIIPYENLQQNKITHEQANEIFYVCKVIAYYMNKISSALKDRNHLEKVEVASRIRNILRQCGITDLRLLTIFSRVVVAVMNNQDADLKTAFNNNITQIINEAIQKNSGECCPICGAEENVSCEHYPTTNEQDEILSAAFYAYLEDETSTAWAIKIAASVVDLNLYRRYIDELFKGYTEMTPEKRMLHFVAGVIRDAVEFHDENASFAYSTYIKFADRIIDYLQNKGTLHEFISEALMIDDIGQHSEFMLAQRAFINEIKEVIEQLDPFIFANARHTSRIELRNDFDFALKLINAMFIKFCQETSTKYDYSLIYRVISSTQLYSSNYDVIEVADNIDETRRGTFKWNNT